MNKLALVAVSLALSTFGATVASAQTYTYNVPTSAGCVTLSQDLSQSSRASDVRALQNFLVSQNYPGGGSWMVTGYFGAATAAAVRNFQQSQGLAITGSVDANTRAAISRVSCSGYGGNVYQPINSFNPTPYTYNNPTPYTYNYNNSYVYNPVYPFNTNPGVLALTSLSANTGPIGSSVTIYGTGFDAANNTVVFGAQPLASIASNGTSLTFTVPPYTASGVVNVKVVNSRGTSNTLTFTVTSYYYPYGNCLPGQGGGAYNYSLYNYTNCSINLPPSNTNAPSLSYLDPMSGGVGTSVTVFGSGFTTSGNTVHFGAGIISNLTSPDGRSVSFIVPTTLVGFGSQVMTLSTYQVSVTNGAGFTSNALPFTVTSLASTGVPTIAVVNGPTSLAQGATGVWTITVSNIGNSYLTTSINWGDSTTYTTPAPSVSYVQGSQTLSFSHVYTTAGTYQITFTASNASGSRSASASVTVPFSSTSNAPTLASIWPGTGSIGTQIVLQGTNFSATDNTVRFGIGGTQHVPSSNGTTIYYTVPSYVSPCDVVPAGGVCLQNVQQVMPGSIQISVSNSNGATSPLYFTVQ